MQTLEPQQLIASSALFHNVHSYEAAAIVAGLRLVTYPQRIWLAFADNPNMPLERSLALHIAQALAERSQKRILMLELCSSDEAVGPHFAMHTEQVRPSLLASTQHHHLLYKHKAPTTTINGQHFPALATLVDSYDGNSQEGINQETSLHEGMLATLIELGELYDYLLIVTTQTTPAHLVQVAADLCHRAIVLISANGETLRSAQRAASSASTPFSSAACSVFVAHVPERPTIGVQERYAARLGLGVAGTPLADTQLTRLLPADTPLLERCWKQQTTLRQVMPDAALTKAVDFVARHIARQTIGIAFGGGGARGFAHIGVLKRLIECGIPLDYISACSIGVATPGMYLLGMSFNEIEEAFLKIYRYMAHWHFPFTSLFSNKSLKRAFLDICGTVRIEDLPTPFAVVAVDLTTRAGVVLDHGPLWQAGLASVAIPGIFPPVVLGKHVLVDAGMHDPVPISVVRKMGADILIASDLNAQAPPAYESATPWLAEAERNQHKPNIRSPHIVDVLLRSYDMAIATIGMHSIREADAVIRPHLHNVALRQFSQAHKFVAAGYQAVEEGLSSLQKRLPWLG